MSKFWVRLSCVVTPMSAVSAVLAKPALAAVKLGTVQLSHLTDSPKTLESAALVLFGVGFIALAFVVRRLSGPAEAE